MTGWQSACQELDGSLLGIDFANCRPLADRILRFAKDCVAETGDVENSTQQDPRQSIRDRLPWA
jgi:hypothetical protein